MNRVITIILGVALTGLFLLMLPYLLLAGFATIIILRLVFSRRLKARSPQRQTAMPAWAQRYQQAYAVHWQKMNAEEREDFLNRNAPRN